MHIYQDNCLPVNLQKAMPALDITSAKDMGFEDLQNGRLLDKVVSEGFEVFFTSDRNIMYQQNLGKYSINMVFLDENKWPSLKDHIDQIRRALEQAHLSKLIIIETHGGRAGRKKK